MATYTVTSDDTLILSDRVFNDFADGDNTTVTFSNNLVEGRTGKNGNTIYAGNKQGENATMTLRLMRGSSDDKFMNGLLAARQKDFVATTLIEGQFVKRLGDGQANVLRDVYTLKGGVIQKNPDGKENVGGDTEQAVTVWQLFFAQASRSIQ